MLFQLATDFCVWDFVLLVKAEFGLKAWDAKRLELKCRPGTEFARKLGDDKLYVVCMLLHITQL